MRSNNMQESITLTARDYQAESVTVTLGKLSQGVARQIIVLPTGAGKTVFAKLLFGSFKKLLFITDTEELLLQSANSVSGGAYGIIKQDELNTSHPCTFASIQTLHKRLSQIDKSLFDLIIIDECHLSMSKSYRKVVDWFTPKLLVGLTATPQRLDGMSLLNLFDEITVNKDIKWGIDNGWLVEIEAVRVRTEVSLSEVRKTAGEFNLGQLERAVNTPVRNHLIVIKYKELSAGKQAIVFCVDVQHCIDLCKAFTDSGIRAAFVVGDKRLCPDRQGIVREYKAGSIDVLLTVMVLNKGFDHDMIETVIMARPTMSTVVYMQGIGRGTRPQRGTVDGLSTAQERITAIQNSRKRKLLVIDIVDNTVKHSLVNTWSLDRGKPLSGKVFMTKVQVAEQEQRQEAVKGQGTRLSHVRTEDEYVNLLSPPVLTNSVSKANMHAPATEKQLAWLSKEGYDVEGSDITRGQASELINAIPAQEWMMRKAVQWGYNPYNLTKTQFIYLSTQHKRQSAETALLKTINLPFINIQ